jgi:hypothetical protein
MIPVRCRNSWVALARSLVWFVSLFTVYRLMHLSIAATQEVPSSL